MPILPDFVMTSRSFASKE